MTAADYNDYLARLESELDEPPHRGFSGILNGIGAGLVVWALIGVAFGVILWTCSK